MISSLNINSDETDLTFLDEIDRRNISDLQVSKLSKFKDDIWDFNYLNIEDRSSIYSLIKFNNIQEEFKYYIKMLILKQIRIEKKSLSTFNKIVGTLRTFNNEYLINNNSILTVSKKDLETYFTHKEKVNKYSYLERMANSLKMIFISIEEVENINFKEITVFLMKKQQKYGKIQKQKAVNDYIPDVFYNQIVSCAILDSKNTELKLDERITACLLVILAETGMRAEELTQLKTNHLEIYKVSSKKKVCYLKFKTYKTIRSTQSFEYTECYMTDKAVEAYALAENLVFKTIDNLSEFVLKKRLLELKFGQSMSRIKSLDEEHLEIINKLTEEEIKMYKDKLKEYIFISGKTGKTRVGTAPLRENYYKFIIRNYSSLKNVDMNEEKKDSLSYLQINSIARYKKFYSVSIRRNNSFEEIKKINYPYVNLHRFRTTVCTKLFKQGIHIDYIMKHMNHISADMTNYYNKSYQLENELENSMKHIQGLINEQGLLITNRDDASEKYVKNELELESSVKKIEQINKYLITNNLNIKKDVNEVLKILKRTNSPAVENEFGICLRSIIHSVCERRKYFHTFDDNYNLEINLDSYKFLNFEYERFKQKTEIVNYNKTLTIDNPEYSIEFDREVKALNKFVNNVLVKQLASLVKDINKKGEKIIIQEFPNLENIIKKRIEILEEVNFWKN